jgi:hypothetical protein
MKRKVYTPTGDVVLECLYVVIAREEGSSQVFVTNIGFMNYCAERFDERKAMDVLAEFGEIQG